MVSKTSGPGWILMKMPAKTDLQMSNLKIASWAAAVLLLLATAGPGSGQGLPKPGPKDKCPVCGMFVAKYPDWTASVRFAGGEQAFFDGVKDMLKFTFNMGRYAPGKTPADVAAVQVTDYYALEPVDGRTAFYVVGSDVFGPMGKELIPFAQRAQAEEFLKDHKGRAIYTWSELAPDLIKTLE